MKKIIFILLGLFVLISFTSGCAVEENKNTSAVHVEEFDGKCAMYITKEDGLYFPLIYGNIALTNIPNSITVDVASEQFELDIKSLNVSSNGLYILTFKQTHAFNFLAKGEHVVDLIIDFGNAIVKLENFATFIADDDYVIFPIANFYPDGIGQAILGMAKTKEWATGPEIEL